MIEVGRWPNLDTAYEHLLVVLAMNHECRLSTCGDGKKAYRIEVSPTIAEEVQRELDLYAAECREAAASNGPNEAPEFPAGLKPTALWVASLWIVFSQQTKNPELVEKFANSTRAVWHQGEWWRSFTSLFLHADIEHLMGNILIGGVFCLLVSVSFGPWRGWVLILLSGFIGNLLNAKFHEPGPFFSIGASTATFGALGLIVGHGLLFAWKNRRYRDLRLLFGPLAAGACLFGWFGVGGADTDVSAHLFGATCGGVIGWLVASWIFRIKPTDESPLRVPMRDRKTP